MPMNQQSEIPVTCSRCHTSGVVRFAEKIEPAGPRGQNGRRIRSVSEGFRSGPQDADGNETVLCATCGGDVPV